MAMDDREFGNLIGSDKVEGTAVFGADDSKIGSIERVMIDKISGRVDTDWNWSDASRNRELNDYYGVPVI